MVHKKTIIQNHLTFYSYLLVDQICGLFETFFFFFFWGGGNHMVNKMLSSLPWCICSKWHEQRPNPNRNSDLKTPPLFRSKCDIQQKSFTSESKITKSIRWITIFLVCSLSCITSLRPIFWPKFDIRQNSTSFHGTITKSKHRITLSFICSMSWLTSLTCLICFCYAMVEKILSTLLRLNVTARG